MSVQHEMHNAKSHQKITLWLKIISYSFIFVVLTDFRKGGDITRLLLPYLSLLLSVLYLSIRKDYKVFKSALFIALACYVLVSYLLVPFSFKPLVSLNDLTKKVLPGICIFLAIYIYSRDPENRMSLLILFTAALVYLLAGGYGVFITGSLDKTTPEAVWQFKPLGFRLPHNIYARSVNTVLPFVFAYAITLNNMRKYLRIVLAVIILFSIFAVFLSLSRGGWVSLTVASFVFIILLSENIKKSFIYIAGLMISILAIFSILWLTVPKFKTRIIDTKKHARTITGRTKIWKNYLNGVKSSPFVGWGYSNKIKWNKKPYLKSELDPQTRKRRTTKHHTHNLFLQVLFHQGAIGLFFFLSFMVLFFINIMKGIKESEKKSYKRILLYAILCIYIGVFIVHGLIEVINFKQMCLVGGYLCGIREITDSELKV